MRFCLPFPLLPIDLWNIRAVAIVDLLPHDAAKNSFRTEWDLVTQRARRCGNEDDVMALNTVPRVFGMR